MSWVEMIDVEQWVRELVLQNLSRQWQKKAVTLMFNLDHPILYQFLQLSI